MPVRLGPFHVAHPVCSIQRIGQLRKHSREMCGLKVFDYFGGDDVWIFSAFQFFRNGFRLRAKKGVEVSKNLGPVAQMGFLSCRAQSRHLLLLVIVKMRDSSTSLGMTEGVNRT